MLANLRNLFNPAAVVQSLAPLPPIASTIMDTFFKSRHPDPLTGQWLPKLNAKTLMAVATDVPGTIWYCAIDSISANNAAVPLHIVPVARDDDSGIMLIAQAKPLPARSSKTVCLCAAVA